MSEITQETTVANLTVGELRSLIREAVAEAMVEATTPSEPTFEPLPQKQPPSMMPKLNIPWHEGLAVNSREDMYGDDGR